MQVALIDHYDSFTFNVLDWLAGAAGPDPVDVVYATMDDEAALARFARDPLPLVLSPGPKRPEDAPASLALARSLLGRCPILGVCLGHQMLGVLAGGHVVQGVDPWHGTTRRIRPVAGSPLFRGLEAGFDAALYNSLVVAPGEALDPTWTVTAFCEKGEIQALERRAPGEAPAFGVQFHPESFLSEGAAQLRRNWLDAVRSWRA